jgi:hypothetical protein
VTADWRGKNGQEETFHDDFARCRTTRQDAHEEVAPLLYVYKARELLPVDKEVSQAPLFGLRDLVQNSARPEGFCCKRRMNLPRAVLMLKVLGGLHMNYRHCSRPGYIPETRARGVGKVLRARCNRGAIQCPGFQMAKRGHGQQSGPGVQSAKERCRYPHNNAQ